MTIFKNTSGLLPDFDNQEIPILNYILGFLVSIFMYNFLEIFSDPGMVPFRLLPFTNELAVPASASIAIHFLHVGLWWTAIALVIPIVLTLLTKESIGKNLRAVFSFSWIMILIPLTDLIISRGQGIDIHYLYPKKFADLLSIYSQFTPGENLTVPLALCLIAKYCFAITKKISATLATVILISAFIILAGLMPFFMRSLAGYFKIILEGISPIPIIRILTIAIFLELTLIFYLKDRGYFLALLKDTDLFKTLNFVLFFILGILLFRPHIGRFLLENIGSFILSVVSVSLVWVFANAASYINNEPQNKKHRIAALGVFLLALLCALAVNFTTLYFMLLSSSLCAAYLFAPFKLKRFALFSKMIISLCLLLLVILGWLFAGGEIFDFPQIFSLYILLFMPICLNVMDIKDCSSDKNAGIKTLPAELGEKKAKLLIGLVFLATYLAIPWLFLNKLLFLPSLLFGLMQAYLINHKKFRQEFVFLTHLISLSLLLVWLNFRI